MGKSLVTSQIVLVLEDSQQLRMVVAQWNRRDLSVNVQKNVSVHIDQVVANWLVIIGKQLHGSCLLEGEVEGSCC